MKPGCKSAMVCYLADVDPETCDNCDYSRLNTPRTKEYYRKAKQRQREREKAKNGK